MDPPPLREPSFMRFQPTPPYPPFVGSLAPNIGRRSSAFVDVPGDVYRAGHHAPRVTVQEFFSNYTPQPPPPGTRAGHFLPRRTVPDIGANYAQQPPPPGCEQKPQRVPGPSSAYNVAHQPPSRPSSLESAAYLSYPPPSYNIAHQPPSMPSSLKSAAYLSYPPPSYNFAHQPPSMPSSLKSVSYPPPWLCPPDFQYPGDLLVRPLTPSLGAPFLLRRKFDWGIDFYIRVDDAGCYHTYPDVGGPFEGLTEAECAIERFLDDRRDPEMSTMDNVSAVDIAVRKSLYRPDGTRRCSVMDGEISDKQRQLVYALVDKYNNDNNLLEDLAFELTKVVCYKSFCEGDVHMWYHHINFTAKAKGAIDCKFFFAEVIFVKGELPVSCLCVIEPTDDGHCFSCRDNGNDLRHPKDVRYAGGHVMRTFSPFSGHKRPHESCVDDWEGREARLRKSLEGFDWSRPPVIPPEYAANVNVYIGTPVWEGGRWRMEVAKVENCSNARRKLGMCRKRSTPSGT